jgi:hypothetical protein
MLRNSKIIVFLFVILLSTNIMSQNTWQLNTITTAVPFLQVTPDARGGAMGDVGVATSPDYSSQFANPSKYAFSPKKYGIGVSYTPWMKKLVNDISLASVMGYYKMDKYNTISGSLRYFTLGNINFTDNDGNSMGDYKPNEFAVDASWSRLLSKRLSMAITGRYIYSNLTLGQNVGGVSTKAGQSFAADLSLFYTKPLKISGVEKSNLAFGVNISNIGAKISYTETTRKDFLPTNLKLGTGLNIDIDAHNTFSIGLDINKLLVPTPPIYIKDSFDLNHNQIILSGKDPNVGIVNGIIQSFYDAPGGMSEEFKEINWSVGAEYWYEKQFAVRLGYFYEDKTKGNRQYFTFGAGLRYSTFGLDVSYLVSNQQNPLANTLRFTLSFDFETLSGENNKPSTK